MIAILEMSKLRNKFPLCFSTTALRRIGCTDADIYVFYTSALERGEWLTTGKIPDCRMTILSPCLE
jgi:hypothetical protein